MLKHRLWSSLKLWIQQESRVLITSSGVASCVIILRLLGVFQSVELTALDYLFRRRLPEPSDQRITIVEIKESDLKFVGQWPIPDSVMAQLLQKIDALHPRAIGLDTYRDLRVPPGDLEFRNTIQSIPNFIGIERLGEDSQSVPPPPSLPKKQVGFNNVVVDADGKVRRSLLYWHVKGKPRTSFALQLALIYLKTKGVTPQAAQVNPEYLQLGKAVFQPFKPSDGAYVGADPKGYQIFANFRRPSSFATVSMTDILEDKVSSDLMRDRIVLIGSTASSLQDFVYTPFSGDIIHAAQPMYGVELHAHFVSQIISAALDGRPLIKVLPDFAEVLWILVWSWLGAALIWRSHLSLKSAVKILLAGFGLFGCSYLAFIGGYWIPLIPPLLTLVGSAVAIVGYLAHLQEELKRSKEFLRTVIDTIPDPIFVKDKEFRWIILNQAYCKFIGYRLEDLIKKSDRDIFPEHEADVFRQQNQLVLRTGFELENEEEFTDAWGNIHLIATKRSLHKDAAGNIFLVGVIRDITERKRSEEQLKEKTAELIRSNTELKLSENRLRYMAYHDPLTGLPNRKQFYERLSQSLEWAAGNNQMAALLFLDLDGFKQVNDTLGHDIGDLLLKAVAERLTACLRGSDTVSRLGGDEFTVILPKIPKVQDAETVADKILTTLCQPFVLEEHTVCITVSIGISVYPDDGESADTLIKNADAAMYHAKESGRNQSYIYHI